MTEFNPKSTNTTSNTDQLGITKQQLRKLLFRGFPATREVAPCNKITYRKKRNLSQLGIQVKMHKPFVKGLVNTKLKQSKLLNLYEFDHSICNAANRCTNDYHLLVETYLSATTKPQTILRQIGMYLIPRWFWLELENKSQFVKNTLPLVGLYGVLLAREQNDLPRPNEFKSTRATRHFPEGKNLS